MIFIFLNTFNKYHLFYLEQTQLFRFSENYLDEFLLKPGGFSKYLSSFIVQFFLLPGAGAAIITLMGIILYVISFYILRKFKIHGFIWGFIPVIFIIALHGDYLYKPTVTIALILSLGYTLFCLFINNVLFRRSAGFFGFIIFYNLAGIFALLIPLLAGFYELFFSKNKSGKYIFLIYLLSMIVVPYLYWKFFYLLTLKDFLLSPLPRFGKSDSKILIFFLLSFLPAFILLFHLWKIQTGKNEIVFSWNWKNWIGGIIIFGAFVFLIKKTYDSKIEQILSIDFELQHSQWDRGLEQSKKFPEANNLISYFTNIALLKSGKIGDQMFHYDQPGLMGLSLPWAYNNIVPFFGGDIYFYLGYNNEAYRWAFEAMEIMGQCPRLLKRLIISSLINGDTKLAEKYLKQLQQSLYYKKWADHYLQLIANPDLLNQDEQIKRKRTLLVDHDFFTGSDKTPLGLEKLLMNHPTNKAAFEYHMAELLLSKDILSFVALLPRLKDFGYTKIPVHYEEAILWYIGYSKQNVIPAGFNIRNSTLERLKQYVYASSRNNTSPELLKNSLKKDFGDTYWYYYHFFNIQKQPQ